MPGLVAVPVVAGRLPVPRQFADPIALLFDRSTYKPEREDEEPPIPTPRRAQERVLMSLVFALLALALVLPISVGGMIDLIRFMGG